MAGSKHFKIEDTAKHLLRNRFYKATKQLCTRKTPRHTFEMVASAPLHASPSTNVNTYSNNAKVALDSLIRFSCLQKSIVTVDNFSDGVIIKRRYQS